MNDDRPWRVRYGFIVPPVICDRPEQCIFNNSRRQASLTHLRMWVNCSYFCWLQGDEVFRLQLQIAMPKALPGDPKAPLLLLPGGAGAGLGCHIEPGRWPRFFKKPLERGIWGHDRVPCSVLQHSPSKNHVNGSRRELRDLPGVQDQAIPQLSG